MFSAFLELMIVHWAGLQHSNIDPLMHLEHMPNEVSPVMDDLDSIATSSLQMDPGALWKEHARRDPKCQGMSQL